MDRIRRPHVEVLPDEALVRGPAEPPSPLPFTHVLQVTQPFYSVTHPQESFEEAGLLDEGRLRLAADGTLEAGAMLVLIDRGNGVYCTVRDARGHVVRTACAGLAPLD
jgi:hypothetical protein